MNNWSAIRFAATRMGVDMRWFKRRRIEMEPLVVDAIATPSATSGQDNVAGPDAPDLEAIENRDADREARRGSAGRPRMGSGPVVLQNTKLDPYSTEPRLIPDTEQKND
jgi:hypothetical protein